MERMFSSSLFYIAKVIHFLHTAKYGLQV